MRNQHIKHDWKNHLHWFCNRELNFMRIVSEVINVRFFFSAYKNDRKKRTFIFSDIYFLHRGNFKVMTIYVKRKNVKFLSQIWTQKFRYYCLFRELFEIFMGLCRNILHKKGVLASKSHRGRHENMWKQSGDNFERKKKFYFFDDFWAQKFRRNVILYPPKMDFLQL